MYQHYGTRSAHYACATLLWALHGHQQDIHAISSLASHTPISWSLKSGYPKKSIKGGYVCTLEEKAAMISTVDSRHGKKISHLLNRPMWLGVDIIYIEQ